MANQEHAQFLGGYFLTRDNVRLFYQRGGLVGSGVPVIFCYGLVCAWTQFKYQIPVTAQNHDVIWWDYRAHHASETPKGYGTLTVENFAKDLIDLMDHLKIERAAIIGHSMGGCVALQAAIEYPSRIDRVMGIGTPIRNPLDSMFGTNITEGFFEFLKSVDRWKPELIKEFYRTQGKSWIAARAFHLLGFDSKRTKFEDVQQYLKKAASLDYKVFLALMENYRNVNLVPRLHSIECPVCVVDGEKDYVVPSEHSDLIVSLVPKARLIEIPGAAHVPQFDNPDLINKIIGEFLLS